MICSSDESISFVWFTVQHAIVTLFNKFISVLLTRKQFFNFSFFSLFQSFLLQVQVCLCIYHFWILKLSSRRAERDSILFQCSERCVLFQWHQNNTNKSPEFTTESTRYVFKPNCLFMKVFSSAIFHYWAAMCVTMKLINTQVEWSRKACKKKIEKKTRLKR